MLKSNFYSKLEPRIYNISYLDIDSRSPGRKNARSIKLRFFLFHSFFFKLNETMHNNLSSFEYFLLSLDGQRQST